MWTVKKSLKVYWCKQIMKCTSVNGSNRRMYFNKLNVPSKSHIERENERKEENKINKNKLFQCSKTWLSLSREPLKISRGFFSAHAAVVINYITKWNHPNLTNEVIWNAFSGFMAYSVTVNYKLVRHCNIKQHGQRLIEGSWSSLLVVLAVQYLMRHQALITKPQHLLATHISGKLLADLGVLIQPNYI